jgi:hypothetical protein
MSSSEISSRVGFVRTDVPEELIDSIFRVERIIEL